MERREHSRGGRAGSFWVPLFEEGECHGVEGGDMGGEHGEVFPLVLI